MKKTTSEVFHVWKKVFTKRKYLLILATSFLIFYFLNGLILNARNLSQVFKTLGFLSLLKFIFNSGVYFHKSVTLFSALGVFLLSLAVGVFITLLFYRYDFIEKRDREKIGFFAGIGIFFGAAAPSCAACGVGLISLLGLSSVLALLPFKGQEVLPISLLLVTFSVIMITRKLYNPVCKLK